MSPPILDSELKAMLDVERIIAPQTEAVRRRVIVRARAAARWQHRAAPLQLGGVRAWWHTRLRIAAFATAGLAVSALCVAWGLLERTPTVPQTANDLARAASPPMFSSVPYVCPVNSTCADQVQVPVERENPPMSRPVAARENRANELELLRLARQALVVGDYVQALREICAHGRRFPKSPMSEEREALRIRALQGQGRSDEARQAAGEFRKQFPQSVLSRQMGEAPSKPQ